MSATTTMTEVERYVAAVLEHLADVPEPEREELVEDLRQHLLEVAAEEGEPLEARLGPPRTYAEELRVSAGLPPQRELGGPVQRLAAAATAHPAVRRGREALRELTGDARMRRLTELGRDLQPGWWVARAYVFLLGWSLSTEPWALVIFPWPRVLGRRSIGLVVLVALVALSLRAGRRASDSRGFRLLSLGFTGLGLLGVMWVSSSVTVAANLPVYFEAAPAWGTEVGGGLIGPEGDRITNIYPFDASGRPLEQVLLYDQDGRPLDLILEQSPYGHPVVTSYPVTDDGVPVTNAFPQRQALRPQHGWDTEGVEPGFGTRPQPDTPVLAPTGEEVEPVDPEPTATPPPPADEAAEPAEPEDNLGPEEPVEPVE